MSAGTALKQIVTFRLGNDLFAADIHAVDRVLRFEQPRRIPNLPDWLEGVVDYQSSVLPVIDLRRRFEVRDVTVGPLARLMIINAEGELVAAIVDEVLDVTPLAAGALSAAPPMLKGLKADFLQGTVQRNGRLVVVLDFVRIFSSAERITLEQMRSGEASVD